MVKGIFPDWGWAWTQVLGFLSAVNPASKAMDTSWYAPNATAINDLDRVLNSEGVYGFIFNSSHTPDEEYGQYNWCNMPHVRRTEYKKAPDDYKLQYVEVIHRHHKRSPYESNLFPHETGSWECTRERTQDSNCSFPQITTQGIADSRIHGRDIYEVYYGLLDFIPKRLDNKKLSFRVTNNQITTQVARPLIDGMYEPDEEVPLVVKAEHNDSLEPDYPCPAAEELFDDARSKKNSTWAAHMKRSKPLFDELDAVSGIPEDSEGWHSSFDHYFDNLSARLCHDMSLPCSTEDDSKCVTEDQADEVFRLGQFEYSHIYRDTPTSLAASAASYGAWIDEVAQHIRDQITGEDGEMVYRHNVAHDGSVSRLLSVLQVDVMVWPGMGSEVVFELYREKKAHNHYHGVDRQSKDYVVRVLFGGQVMRSSSPDLGLLEFIPVDALLDYFDKLPEKCEDEMKSEL